MEIKFDKTSPVAAELTLTLEQADYQERVDKALKNYRKRAALPGFRPGQVPIGLLKKRFGADIKAEELQRLLSEKLYGYLQEEHVNLLSDPLASEKQGPLDIEADSHTFVFDLALTPEFDAKLSKADTLPFFHIGVADSAVDRQVQAFAQRAGHYTQAETYQEGDMVKGHLAELDAEGNIKEGGLQKEDAVLLVGYFKDEDQKKKFDGVGVNTVVTFNPSQAYAGSEVEISTLLGIGKEEAAQVKADFSYQITELTRYVPAAVDQELFDQVMGEGQVHSEEEFRQAIRTQLAAQLEAESRHRFVADVRTYLEQRIGQLEWPDELLKRIMKANNPDHDQKFIDDNYADSLRDLEWQLIKKQLADQSGVKVERADILETAKAYTRQQFAQYGMGNLPEDVVERYAEEQLQKRQQASFLTAVTEERKLGEALTGLVTLDEKDISEEDFRKLNQEQQA